MKTATTIFIIILSLNLHAQKKTNDLSVEEIKPFIVCKYSQVIDMDKADTSYYVYMAFQNEKYKSITDVQSVGIADSTMLADFIKDLKGALAEMDNKASQMDWDRKRYKIHKYDFSKDLYLENYKGGYVIINKKSTESLIAWLESIRFAKT